MSVVGETYVRVRPDTVGFGAALNTQVSAASRRAGAVAGAESAQGFSEGFSRTLKTGALLVGVTGAFEAVKDSVKEAAGLAGEIALVENAAERAGAANQIYGKSIEDLVTKQELQKGFTDEQLYPSFSRLITATGSIQKAYKDLQLAEDVSRQRRIDVTVAALALAKAEDGSVTSLQRLGIILPKHILDLKGAEKATAAVAFTQQKFAGAATDFADTGAGALARFGAAVHVLRGAAGEALLPEVEHAANATADWASKSENLERVQQDVATAGQVVAGSVHAIATGFDAVETAVGPVVSALGGVEKTTELVFGAIAVKKVQALTLGVLNWGTTTTAAETSVAAATAAEAAATTAASAASVRQIAIYGARGEVLTTVAVAEGEVAAATGASGIAAGAGAAKFLSFGLSAGGAASVLKSGVAPAAVLAGYELSTFIRKIPGWNSEFDSLGAHAESLAEKLNLIPRSGISKPSLAAGAAVADQDIQEKLAAAYKTITAGGATLEALIQKEQRAGAISPAFNAQNLGKEGRDALIAAILGPGFTFEDAQAFGTAPARHAASGDRSAGSRRNYDPEAAAAVTKAGRPTDVDYKIQVQEALATKTTADEEALYKSRLVYVTKRVAALKADNNLTADEKKNLLRLETEQASLQSAITAIDTDAAQTAKDAADKAHQAYTDLLGIRDQNLQLQAQRAQLTQSNNADDLKAAEDQVAFYRVESHDAKLTAEERARYASQAVGAQQQIQSINQQIHQQETQDYRDQLSLTEQRLQLAAKRAELTGKSIADDKAAARKLIAFYTKESHDAKLTEQERLKFASQAIDERIALKNLSGQQQGATAQQIFGEAAAEFRSFGSNIATRSGVLSGQDARASFAAQLLGSGGAMDIAARAAAQQRSAALTEAQRQTALLAEIARSLGGRGPRKNVPEDFQSADARRVANLVGR